MTTKETNDLMSLIADTAFRIGIIIDKAYQLDQVEDKDIREHGKNVINSLLSAKEMCVESNLDWNVCILLSRINLDKYVESKID